VEARSATNEEQKADAVIDTGPSRGGAKRFEETADREPPRARQDSIESKRVEKAEGLPSDPGSGRSTSGPDDATLRQSDLLDSIEMAAPSPKKMQSREGETASQEHGTQFDPGDDFFIFPKEESEEGTDQPRPGGQISVLPFVSLLGILLFVFSLVTMTYQVDPAPLESLIRKIPWYGSAIFESRHFKRGLALEALTSGLQPVLGQREVIIISGTLVNRNTRGVQDVQIEAQIYDAEGKPLGKQTIFLGSAIASKIIQDMTPREISLLQSLKPQNVYRIEPNESVRFTIVLPKPEQGVSAFSCRVVSAEATA